MQLTLSIATFCRYLKILLRVYGPNISIFIVSMTLIGISSYCVFHFNLLNVSHKPGNTFGNIRTQDSNNLYPVRNNKYCILICHWNKSFIIAQFYCRPIQTIVIVGRVGIAWKKTKMFFAHWQCRKTLFTLWICFNYQLRSYIM